MDKDMIVFCFRSSWKAKKKKKKRIKTQAQEEKFLWLFQMDDDL